MARQDGSDQKSGSGKGGKRAVSRRALLGAAAGLAALQLPAWLLGVNAAYALDHWWYAFGYENKNWDIPDDGICYCAFSERSGFFGISPEVGQDGTRYRELWAALGVEASSNWRTELYYHFNSMALSRCGAKNVITGYEGGKGHGWVKWGTDHYIEIVMSYGHKDDEGMANISEASCEPGASYYFGSDLATSIASNDPADSGWYEAIGPLFDNLSRSYAFTLRRKRQDVRAVLTGNDVVFGFNHARFPLPTGDFYCTADVGMVIPRHVLANAFSGVTGIYKILACADASFAVTCYSAGIGSQFMVAWTYRDDTAQNWYFEQAKGDATLSRIRSVASEGQGAILEQYLDRVDYNSSLYLSAASTGMGQQWWIHRIVAGSAQDMNGYGSRGNVYQLFANSSGRSLATTMGHGLYNGVPLQVHRDADSTWHHEEYYWQVVKVVFAGTVALSVEGGQDAAPRAGQRVVCSNPYRTCRPYDRLKTGSVEYWYTWYVSDTPGGSKRVVKAEYRCDNANHDAQATLDVTEQMSGKHIHVRVRLRLNLGVFYDGEVWATLGVASSAKQVRFHLDDTSSVWKSVEFDGTGAYTVDASITQQARRANCHRIDGTQGFDGWYVDARYSTRYTPREIAGEHLDLYGRNWATVAYANGRASDVSSVYSAQGRTGSVDYVARMPSRFEKPYGSYAALGDPAVKRLSYDGGAWFPLTLKARDGWCASWECTGSTFTSITVRGDTTVYKPWDASVYDGVVANGD